MTGDEILDDHGRPVSASCPDCGSPEKDHETVNGFGGHWRKHCVKCGHVFDSGQDRPKRGTA